MAAATRRRRKQTKRRNGLLKIWRGEKAKLGRRRVVTAAAATHRKDWRLVGGSSKKGGGTVSKMQQQRSARTFKGGLHASLEIRPRRCDRSGAGGWVGETHLRPTAPSRVAPGQQDPVVTCDLARGDDSVPGRRASRGDSFESVSETVGRSETSEATQPGPEIRSPRDPRRSAIVERRYFARWRFVDWCLRRRNAACLVVEVGRVGEAGAIKDDLSEADAGLGIAACVAYKNRDLQTVPTTGIKQVAG